MHKKSTWCILHVFKDGIYIACHGKRRSGINLFWYIRIGVYEEMARFFREKQHICLNMTSRGTNEMGGWGTIEVDLVTWGVAMHRDMHVRIFQKKWHASADGSICKVSMYMLHEWHLVLGITDLFHEARLDQKCLTHQSVSAILTAVISACCLDAKQWLTFVFILLSVFAHRCDTK